MPQYSDIATSKNKNANLGKQNSFKFSKSSIFHNSAAPARIRYGLSARTAPAGSASRRGMKMSSRSWWAPGRSWPRSAAGSRTGSSAPPSRSQPGMDQIHAVITTWHDTLYSRFCKLFSESSNSLPALLPFALLLRRTKGTLRSKFTNPHCTWDFVT